MSEISTYKLVKEKLQAIPNLRLKGSWFEKVSKRFLKEHDSADEYESIDLWSDFKLRGNKGDRGIDMVITTTSKEYIAVQCKFHQDSISYNDLSSFFTKLQSGVGEIGFKKGIIISTSNLTSNALEEIEQIRKSKGIDIVEISEEDFIYSQIDWEKFDPTQTQGELPLCDKKKPRPHQTEAIKATKEYFSNPKNTRGKLIMACGTGKTYTSLKIMEALDPKITLFLAPSIALLSQTFREYAQEKSEPFYASIVCSDDKVGKGKKNKNDDDTDDIDFSELPNKPSTRLEDILSVCEKAQKENKRFIIFSTYQSVLRIKEAQEVGLGEIDLVICDEALKEKFLNNLFAFDIVLLAYYIALINITQAAQNRDGSLKTFKNIALTDSLDFYEEKTDKGVFDLFKDLEENKEIKSTIEKQNIRVIIGNPPYSAGAKSQNDNNQNLSHPKLEKRVYEKYGQISTAKVGKTTRDTLIQSIYMASELLKDKGVLGFVVNGGFIDSKSADGFRKSVAKDFSHLYVLNLRGNARTSGETFKKEGGKIFDSGSRATIAVIFFVKDASVKNSAIHYYDIGDYLKREEKLNRLSNFTNLDAIPFETITPNNKGDWINQREDAFDKLIPLKRDKKRQNPSVFDINSNGVSSGCNPWVYNFSKDALRSSVQKCIDTYNADLKRFNAHFREAFKSRAKGVKSADLYKQLNDKEITTDKTRIAWTRALKQEFIKNKNLQESHKDRIRLALYRPFNKQWLYFDKNLNEAQSQLPKIFPDKDAQNVVINTGVGNGKNFSALVSDAIPDIHFIGNANAYPLYYYDDLGNRHYAISGYALNLFRKHYEDNSIAEEEIFYYIYAILHHKGYLEKYKNSLAKEDPRIALSKDFKELSTLGKELGELHLNYESEELHTSVEYQTLMNAEEKGYYDVETMTKKGDRIHYNNHIAITKIPKKAFDYVVNGKSAIDWVIERYKKTRDKDSLIENNPNDYKGGKYVFELLCRVIKLSEKSVDLIEKISEKRFE